MSVKLELYRVFKEVAEAGNITAAAQALYISQSAVSQSIKTLEKKLDVRFIEMRPIGLGKNVHTAFSPASILQVPEIHPHSCLFEVHC